jgi:hypothetical protein
LNCSTQKSADGLKRHMHRLFRRRAVRHGWQAHHELAAPVEPFTVGAYVAPMQSDQAGRFGPTCCLYSSKRLPNQLLKRSAIASANKRSIF